MPMRLDDLLMAVYLPRRLPDAKPDTIRNYRWCFGRFATFLGHEPRVGDLTEESIGAFLRSMNDGRHAPATVNRCLYCLLGLAKVAFRKRLLPEEPILRPLREFRHVPTAWTALEMRRLIDATDRFRPLRRISGVNARAWWRAFLVVAYATGARRSAMLGLVWSDVDFAAGSIRLRAETAKTRAEQVVFVCRECVAALRLILQPARKLVFPDDRHQVAFYKDWDRLLRWAGLPGGRWNKTQRIRRTAATHAESIASGAGQSLLGHSSQEMTTQHYLDPSQLPRRLVILPSP